MLIHHFLVEGGRLEAEVGVIGISPLACRHETSSSPDLCFHSKSIEYTVSCDSGRELWSKDLGKEAPCDIGQCKLCH
jgi:hypothetical protein